MAAEGVFPKADGDILYGSEVNNFNINGWTEIKYDDEIYRGLIKFDDDTWQTQTSRSTDAGSNWTVSGTANGYGIGYVAATTGSVGTAIYTGSPAVTKFTVNAGATWTVSATSQTDPSFDSGNGVAVFGSVAVVYGEGGALGSSSWAYSVNYGDNFTTVASGVLLGGEAGACGFLNSTTGYGCDNAANIWKTTDGGSSWQDTGDQWTGNMNSIIVSGTNLAIGIGNEKIHLTEYINSTNTSTVKVKFADPGASTATSNAVKADNGNYYWVQWSASTASDDIGKLTLCKYDGISVSIRPLGPSYDGIAKTYWRNGANASTNITTLIHVNDVLYLNTQDNIFRIPINAN